MTTTTEFANLTPATGKGDAAYRKNYQRGWAASARASDGALERADGRGEPDAWYDGYMDYAVGREKWALMYFESPEAYYAHFAAQNQES